MAQLAFLDGNCMASFHLSEWSISTKAIIAAFLNSIDFLKSGFVPAAAIDASSGCSK